MEGLSFYAIVEYDIKGPSHCNDQLFERLMRMRAAMRALSGREQVVDSPNFEGDVPLPFDER